MVSSSRGLRMETKRDSDGRTGDLIPGSWVVFVKMVLEPRQPFIEQVLLFLRQVANLLPDRDGFWLISASFILVNKLGSGKHTARCDFHSRGQTIAPARHCGLHKGRRSGVRKGE